MDEQVIKLCTDGNRQAQAQVYEFYAPKMFTICLRYAPDRATAEDILQDSFMKVFAKIGSFKGDGALGAWIRRVVINTALEHLRRIQIHSKRYVDLDICYDISVEEDILSQITFSEVMNAIKKIPVGYREVLNLYAIDGYTHREISKMLDISEGNSKQRVRRARNMLKEIISEKSNSEGSKLNETAA